MKRFVVIVLAGLAGCGPDPQHLDTSGLLRPESEWMVMAKPLPDIPACDHLAKKPRAWVECRVEYDSALRSSYVELAGRHKSLVAYINVIVPPTPKAE